MVRNLAKRLGQLALLTVALFGAVLVPLFLRGMYYVQPNADNWRLLPYIVPAASYEQQTFTASNGLTDSRSGICLDQLQGRAGA